MGALRESRLREKQFRTEIKYKYNDYKMFRSNFGFGSPFRPIDIETHDEKKLKERRREEYAQIINNRNVSRSSTADNTQTKRKIYPNLNQKDLAHPKFTYQHRGSIRAERNKTGSFSEASVGSFANKM